MKDTLEYYYGLDIDELEELDGKYHFKIDNQDYFFVFYNRGLEELDDIINVSSEMFRKGINVNKILLNKNNSYLTKVGEYNYILFSVTNLNEEYDIFDMVKISEKLVLNNSKSNLYRNNWSKLWSEKVDYFEYQVSEFGLKYPLIRESIDYFVGIAENAICMINNYISNNNLYLQHRRIDVGSKYYDFYNPLNLIFDTRIRDFCEYYKSNFMYNYRCKEEMKIINYLEKADYTITELKLLYIRLFFPSYYFDLYEKVVSKNENENKIKKVVQKVDDYQLFLYELSLYLKQFFILPHIEWISEI